MLSLHFSRTTEYAFRAMASLALGPRGQPMTAEALSEAAGVPRHYVSKIMKTLVEAGLAMSRKGHGGGFVLGKPKEEIRYVDILAASGYEPHPDRCVFGWGGCNHEAPCPLHESWSALNEAFGEWAMKGTLADVGSRHGLHESSPASSSVGGPGHRPRSIVRRPRAG